MEIWYAHAAGISGYLRPLPFHRKRDRSVAQDAEVVAVVRVLPDVLARENEITSESLLNASVELIAKARIERRYTWHRTAKKRIQHSIRAPGAGEHQIFVEGSFQQSRVGDAEYGIRLLDVVRDSEARLNFLMGGKPIVEIAAQA